MGTDFIPSADCGVVFTISISVSGFILLIVCPAGLSGDAVSALAAAIDGVSAGASLTRGRRRLRARCERRMAASISARRVRTIRWHCCSVMPEGAGSSPPAR